MQESGDLVWPCTETEETFKDQVSLILKTLQAPDLILNGNKLCRVCLSKASIPLYGGKFSKQLICAMECIGGVQLTPTDALPKSLCVTCHALLQNGVLLRKKAQETDRLLRQFVPLTVKLGDNPIDNEIAPNNIVHLPDNNDNTAPKNCNETPANDETAVNNSSDSKNNDNLPIDNNKPIKANIWSMCTQEEVVETTIDDEATAKNILGITNNETITENNSSETDYDGHQFIENDAPVNNDSYHPVNKDDAFGKSYSNEPFEEDHAINNSPETDTYDKILSKSGNSNVSNYYGKLDNALAFLAMCSSEHKASNNYHKSGNDNVCEKSEEPNNVVNSIAVNVNDNETDHDKTSANSDKSEKNNKKSNSNEAGNDITVQNYYAKPDNVGKSLAVNNSTCESDKHIKSSSETVTNNSITEAETISYNNDKVTVLKNITEYDENNVVSVALHNDFNAITSFNQCTRKGDEILSNLLVKSQILDESMNLKVDNTLIHGIDSKHSDIDEATGQSSTSSNINKETLAKCKIMGMKVSTEKPIKTTQLTVDTSPMIRLSKLNHLYVPPSASRTVVSGRLKMTNSNIQIIKNPMANTKASTDTNRNTSNLHLNKLKLAGSSQSETKVTNKKNVFVLINESEKEPSRSAKLINISDTDLPLFKKRVEQISKHKEKLHQINPTTEESIEVSTKTMPQPQIKSAYLKYIIDKMRNKQHKINQSKIINTVDNPNVKVAQTPSLRNTCSNIHNAFEHKKITPWLSKIKIPPNAKNIKIIRPSTISSNMLKEHNPNLKPAINIYSEKIQQTQKADINAKRPLLDTLATSTQIDARTSSLTPQQIKRTVITIPSHDPGLIAPNDSQLGQVKASPTTSINTSTSVSHLGKPGLWKRNRFYFKCKDCNTRYNFISFMAHNESDHPDKKKLECPFCGKYIVVGNFEKHSFYHVRGYHQCAICGKKILDTRNYRTHLLIHSNDLPYQCDLCPYRGRTKLYLKNHMKVHCPEKKYKCPCCPKAFKTASNLKSHSMVHAGGFECEICKVKLRTRRGIKNHMQLKHLKTTNYSCSMCGKGFILLESLRNHEIVSHKRKKFKRGNHIHKLFAD